jgi:hypothetical protein
MIELDQVNTWPVQILKILENRASFIKDEREREEQSLCDGSYILNPVYCHVYDETVEELKNILLKHKIRGYHCTKVINWNDIQRKGLTVLRLQEFQITLIDELKNIGIDRVIIEKIKDSFVTFEKNKSFVGREGLLWFVLTKELTEYIGCEEFFKFYGGEVTRRAVWPVKDIVYPILQKIGIPTVIECSLNISDAMDFQVINICKEMINYGVQKFIFKNDYSLQCEMCVKHDVLSNDIIKIWEKDIS